MPKSVPEDSTVPTDVQGEIFVPTSVPKHSGYMTFTIPELETFVTSIMHVQ